MTAGEVAPAISVVVPFFEEEESVPRFFEELLGVLDRSGLDAEVVAVDDGSGDATWDRLAAVRDRDPRVRAIRFRRNFGQTAALAAGFEAARGGVIVTMDGDLGARVTEMPVNHRPRTLGRSKYGLSRTVRVVLDLLTVKFLSDYSTRPIQVFGLLGLAGASIGILLLLLLGVERLLLGMDIGNRPIVLLAILLVVTGLQFITFGLLGEMLARTYHESQGKPVYVVRERLG